jgi:hypothetical protein
MSSLVWIAVGAVIGIATVLIVAGGRLAARRGPVNDERASPIPIGAMARGPGDTVRVRLAAEDLQLICREIERLHVLRTDIQRIGAQLERVLQETMDQGARVSQPRAEPSGPPRGPAREGPRELMRSTEPTPVLGGWQREARDPVVPVQRDEPFDARAPVPGGSGWSAPAAAQAREPSAEAVFVEASNDAVVSSDRHPPEAWLERRGGEGEVWLNPRVTLSDPALQRWSTFFTWERREPGARYEATRPAVVTSAGGVVSKGTARPL